MCIERRSAASSSTRANISLGPSSEEFGNTTNNSDTLLFSFFFQVTTEIQSPSNGVLGSENIVKIATNLDRDMFAYGCLAVAVPTVLCSYTFFRNLGLIRSLTKVTSPAAPSAMDPA